jgi:hypothetical protein
VFNNTHILYITLFQQRGKSPHNLGFARVDAKLALSAHVSHDHQTLYQLVRAGSGEGHITSIHEKCNVGAVGDAVS